MLIISTSTDDISIQEVSPLSTMPAICSTVGALINSGQYFLGITVLVFSIILLAVIFLNLLEKLENILFEGNNRGYASD